ncbi:hypothetical protein M409DRAFT_24675 [Zasmidium cellare ATCC 36951]|uniref:Uncharacterized protein n=1 Tax=Zasmidium cellare ATCC 36951 TaxID=1080233 RepID=A0A6A6CEU5_ZASCE|nr:uncharacterized protein M409DRAFT_24675 [Zasmidium cellare ATCC 36951]KAF2164770.1 hypothetical protein M409DRAFT_24675 [Zasmidium cellare ATCC 36951]
MFPGPGPMSRKRCHAEIVDLSIESAAGNDDATNRKRFRSDIEEDPVRVLRNLTSALQKLSIEDADEQQSPPQQSYHGVYDNVLASLDSQNKDNKEKPTLMTLPRELRDMIYEFALTQRVEIIVWERQTPTASGAALLCVCKQVYEEALPVYCQRSTFFSHSHGVVLCWVKRLRPQVCKWMRDIRFEHTVQDPAASKARCVEFIAVKNVTMKRARGRRVLGKDVLKTFYYTPAGERKPTFLTLPRELRDIIYDYAFTQQVELEKELKPATSRNAALLCTCRQAYREGLKPYYQNTTFISFDHRSFLTWVRTLPSRVRRWVKDMRRVDFSQHYAEARTAYTMVVFLCRLVRDISGGDIADGVFKTSFVGKDDTFAWYSLDQISGSKRVEDVPAFRDFYHHHRRL